MERGSNASSAKSSRNQTPNPTPPRNGAVSGNITANTSKTTTPSQSSSSIEVVERVIASPNNPNINKTSSNLSSAAVHIQERPSTANVSGGNNSSVDVSSNVHTSTKQASATTEQDSGSSNMSKANDSKRPADILVDEQVANKKARNE